MASTSASSTRFATTMLAGRWNTCAPLVEVISPMMSRRCSRVKGGRASAAPSAALTPSTFAVQTAYHPRAEATGSRSLSGRRRRAPGTPGRATRTEAGHTFGAVTAAGDHIQHRAPSC